MKKNNDWKERLGIVFSTNPDYEYGVPEDEPQTPENAKQRLHVFFEKAGRKGKTVTIVDGFKGRESDLEILGRRLKTYLGTGGSCKDGQLIIQGNMVEKAKSFLAKEGYGLKG